MVPLNSDTVHYQYMFSVCHVQCCVISSLARKSVRQSTSEHTRKTNLRLQERQDAPRRRRGAHRDRPLTQEELLAEAKITAELNIRSLGKSTLEQITFLSFFPFGITWKLCLVKCWSKAAMDYWCEPFYAFIFIYVYSTVVLFAPFYDPKKDRNSL